MIRILVVGGTQVYREALGAALEMPGRFTVIGIASSGDQAIGLLHDWNPDAVLIDLPRAEGLAASHSLFLSDPQIIVIPLNLPPDEEEIVAWAEAGAAAFLLQDGSLDDLRAVIEGAVRGELRCSPTLVASFVRRLRTLSTRRPVTGTGRVPLTGREREIVSLIDQGFSNKQIAQRLGIEIGTAKNHVHNILRKLTARRRSEAAARVAGRLLRSH